MVPCPGSGCGPSAKLTQPGGAPEHSDVKPSVPVESTSQLVQQWLNDPGKRGSHQHVASAAVHIRMNVILVMLKYRLIVFFFLCTVGLIAPLRPFSRSPLAVTHSYKYTVRRQDAPISRVRIALELVLSGRYVVVLHLLNIFDIETETLERFVGGRIVLKCGFIGQTGLREFVALEWSESGPRIVD